MTTLENKIRGALFGVAVGDALGAPLEFMKARDIRHKYGIVQQYTYQKLLLTILNQQKYS